ncbi:hypothetical protein [Arenibacter sp. S6351L]|uniref:hypothetical protein n=1 Tax=Arenibacter sp. S6351L TaxID=2926407 RepID=UPI001FF3323F|nr:hypothetical protein [Arenibacter sp. S6351L]MCK0137348.1 hypothetical protein [Arenibacter sp. S6351L]
MQNLYWILGLFGKENVVHGKGQHAWMLPSAVPHWCTKTLFHNAPGLLVLPCS